jgi:ABC-type glutathione transport system ATPase component
MTTEPRMNADPKSVDLPEEENSVAGKAPAFEEIVGKAHTASELDPNAPPVLTVSNLRMYFPVRATGMLRRKVGDVQAVDGVSVSRAAASRRPVARSRGSTSRRPAR